MPAGLNPWMEIADYLGITVRTAQRWEADRGLSVRRLPGDRGRVVASITELDRWRESVGRQPEWWNNLRLLRACALVLTVAVGLSAAAVAGLYFTRSAIGLDGDWDGDGRIETVFAYQSVRAMSEGEWLYCFDQSGGLRWRYQPRQRAPTF